MLSGFIEIDAARERIRRFMNTGGFLNVPGDEHVGAIAFIRSVEENVSEQILEFGVNEDAILKEVKQLKIRIIHDKRSGYS